MNFTVTNVLLLAGGALLMFSGVTGVSPKAFVVGALDGQDLEEIKATASADSSAKPEDKNVTPDNGEVLAPGQNDYSPEPAAYGTFV